jgi:thiol-disulfide isomerase/thioredoxin
VIRARKLFSCMLLICVFMISACSKKPVNIYNNKVSYIFHDASNHEFLFNQYKGRVIIINYWASWCPPCIHELPELVKLQAKYPEDLVIVGVNLEQLPAEDLQALIQKFALNFPVITDDPAQLLGIESPAMYPTSIIVDKEGKITQVQRGEIPQELYKLLSSQS